MEDRCKAAPKPLNIHTVLHTNAGSESWSQSAMRRSRLVLALALGLSLHARGEPCQAAGCAVVWGFELGGQGVGIWGLGWGFEVVSLLRVWGLRM